LETAVWLPLLLLGLRELAFKLSPSSLLLTCLGGTLAFLPGNPQTSAYVWLAGIAYYLFKSRERGLAWTESLKRLFVVVPLVLGTAAVQLLPSMEFARFSNRKPLPLAESGSGFPVEDIIQFIQPGFVSHWHPLYVGILPLALAVASLKLRWEQVRFWAGLGLTGFLLSFGTNLPLYEILYQLSPFHKITRSQERHAIWVSLALAVMAAYGLTVLMEEKRLFLKERIRNIGKALGLLALGLTLMLPVVIYLARLGIDPSDHRRLPRELAISVLVCWASWIWWELSAGKERSRLGTGLTALGIVAFNLLSFNRGLDAVSTLTLYPDHPAITIMAQELHRPFRFYDEYRLPGNFGCWFGFEDIGGVSPIRPWPYYRFLKEAPEPIKWWLLGVRYVITWGRELPDMKALGREAILLVEIPEGEEVTRIFRLDPPLSWGWVVHSVRVVGTLDEALAALWAPDFNPAGEAVVQGTLKAPLGDVQGQRDEVELILRTPTEVRYRVQTEQPGLLITREPWYPGWYAEVNGMGTPVLIADGALMAVALPSGESEVVFRFRPFSLRVGLTLTLITLLVLWPLALVLIRSPSNSSGDSEASPIEMPESRGIKGPRSLR